MLKKIATLLLTVSLLLTAAACSTAENVSELPQSTTPEQSAESHDDSSRPESSVSETAEEASLDISEISWSETPADPASVPGSKAPESSQPESKNSASSQPQSSASSSRSESSASSVPSSSAAPSSVSSSEPSAPAPSSQPSQASQPSKPSRTPSSSEPSESSQMPDVQETAEIGGAVLYQQLFDLQSTVTMQITMSESEMNKMQQDYNKYKRIGSKSPIYRRADLILTVNGQTYEIKEVGIRPKGNMSLVPVYDDDGNLNLSHYKLSFRETFDDADQYGSDAKVWSDKNLRSNRKKRRVATLKELDVKWNSCYDETYLREIYASEIARENNVLVQQIGLSQLTFNQKNYGVMKIYEPVDEIFLEKNLPASALGGDLYKVGWTYSPASYVKNRVTYGVEDKETGKKYNYNLKTNKKTSDHSSLKNLLSVLSGTPTQAQYESVVDGDYFARFLAVSYFLGDPDDMRNNYNNHYLYFRKDTGKAIFIIYDNDRTLGVTYGYNPDGTGMTGQSPYSAKAAGKGDNQQNPLIRYGILNHNGYLRSSYDSYLSQVSSSSLWETGRFSEQYQTITSHYQNVVTPDISFGNVKKEFRFSLDGVYSSGDKSNMSFTDYVTRIMKTYRAS